MYRIVASDMDQTFLAEDHSIPAANCKAIARMRDAGVLFVPASGRAYGSIMESLASVRELLEGSYILSYNGGCITRVDDGQRLSEHQLPFDIVKRVFEWGLTYDVGFHIYELSGRCWGVRLNDEERSYLAGHMAIDELSEGDVETLRDVPIAKMLYVRPDLNYLHKLADTIPIDVYAGATTTFSSGRYLEFNPVGVDKGSGLRDLAAIVGVSMDEVVACGDAANDLSMIEAAGCGVVVSNATPDVVAIANYRAKASCNDGVLAEVVRNVLKLSAP